MQEDTPNDWVETFTSEIADETRPHTPITNTIGQKGNFYNTLYRAQTNTRRSTKELYFGIFRVPNWTSVRLNSKTNLEQFEHFNVRVPIQPRAQRNSHEQKIWIEHEIQVLTTRVPICSAGQLN